MAEGEEPSIKTNGQFVMAISVVTVTRITHSSRKGKNRIMNNKQKLLACVLAALPLSTMADVTIYGSLQVGFENIRDRNNVTVNHIADFGSFLGFTGIEDLAGGNQAVWQVESGFRVDGQTTGIAPYQGGTFAGRQSFVGLQGKWGSFKLGNMWDYGYRNMEIINTWYSEVPSLQLYNFTGIDTIFHNAVRYDSPDFGGFSFALMHATDETAGMNKDVNNIGLSYGSGPILAKYQLLRQHGLSEGHADQFHRVEGTYTLGDWTFGLGYAHNIAYTAADQKVVAKDAALTVNYSIGNFKPKFSFDHGWNVTVDGTTQTDTKYNQFIVGVDYTLSKRTTAGVSYGRIISSSNNAYCNGDIAINPNFFVACAKERAVGVQLVHNF